MINKDKQTLEMLRGEFEKSADSAKIPLRLQKESIVFMLEKDKRQQRDFSDKTGTKKQNISLLRKTAAIAAMLSIVVIGALAMRAGGGVSRIKSESFYESGAFAKNAQNYEEVERDVKEILGIKESTAVSSEQTSKADVTNRADKSDTSSVSETSAVVSEKKLLEGYSFNPASENSEESKNMSAVLAPYLLNSEADTVKSDGDYLYVVSSAENSEGVSVEKVSILKIIPNDNMQIVSEIVLSNFSENENAECKELYLKDGRLVAIMTNTESSAASNETYTFALYYDITNPSAPKLIRKHRQNGEYLLSKLSENKLYLATSAAIEGDLSSAGADEIIPAFYIDGKETKVDAKSIFNDGESALNASFLFVTVTDVSNLSSDVASLAFFGGGRNVYISGNAIVVSKEYVSDEKIDEKNSEAKKRTVFYRFNANGSFVELAGTGIVDGFVVGSVCVDDDKGYLRAVTFVNGAHNVYVLNENMELVGGLEKIFSGEDAKTVKYIGNKGYVVSGSDEEKMMIIDFSKSEPKVAGTVSAKGFPDKLYEISDELLLGVENSENEKTIKLILFDVSDSENPKISSTFELSDEYEFAAENDVHCVMTDTEKQMWALSLVKTDGETGERFSTCAVFGIDKGQILFNGECVHSANADGDVALRSVCAGDAIYTVSGKKTAAFSFSDFKEVSEVELY